MSETDSNIMAAAPDAEAGDGPSQDWLIAKRITREEHENNEWGKERSVDAQSHKAIKQALGLSYEGLSGAIDGLDNETRRHLSEKNPEDIAAYLEERADAERDQKKRKEESEKQAAEQVEKILAANETPQLSEVRNAMRTSFQEAASFDERIAELQRLNNMREDLDAEDWKDVPAELWRLAREGKLEGWDSEIANLIQEKQAKLAEAAIHQNAYHEAARTVQARQPAPETPIGQITGKDGQPIQLTRTDIRQIVQLERDEQNFVQRGSETVKRHPDWGEAAQIATRAGVDVTQAQARFIMTLPNGPDVAYYLTKNHAETRAIYSMNNHEASRALINLSHKLATQSAAEDAPKKATSAPKPPALVSGASSRAFDVSDESLSNEEWQRQRNAQVARRRSKS